MCQENNISKKCGDFKKFSLIIPDLLKSYNNSNNNNNKLIKNPLMHMNKK